MYHESPSLIADSPVGLKSKMLVFEILLARGNSPSSPVPSPLFSRAKRVLKTNLFRFVLTQQESRLAGYESPENFAIKTVKRFLKDLDYESIVFKRLFNNSLKCSYTGLCMICFSGSQLVGLLVCCLMQS